MENQIKELNIEQISLDSNGVVNKQETSVLEKSFDFESNDLISQIELASAEKKSLEEVLVQKMIYHIENEYKWAQDMNEVQKFSLERINGLDKVNVENVNNDIFSIAFQIGNEIRNTRSIELHKPIEKSLRTFNRKT